MDIAAIAIGAGHEHSDRLLVILKDVITVRGCAIPVTANTDISVIAPNGLLACVALVRRRYADHTNLVYAAHVGICTDAKCPDAIRLVAVMLVDYVASVIRNEK